MEKIIETTGKPRIIIIIIYNRRSTISCSRKYQDQMSLLGKCTFYNNPFAAMDHYQEKHTALNLRSPSAYDTHNKKLNTSSFHNRWLTPYFTLGIKINLRKRGTPMSYLLVGYLLIKESTLISKQEMSMSSGYDSYLKINSRYII